MYAAIRDIDDTRTLHAAPDTLKAKIVNIHKGSNQRYILGTTEGEQQEKEQPKLFHLIRKWKRQKQHHVETVRDEQGNLCTSTAVFMEHLRQKLAEIAIDQHAIQDLLDGVNLYLDIATHIGLQQPIREAELHMAVWRGKRNKASGYDGVPTDFLQLLWPIIKNDLLQVINEMYLGGALPRMQTRGVVVCVPKTPRPMKPEEYRLLTLLNSDVRLFVRIIVNGIRPWLTELIHPSQCGGVGDNNILDALALLRETVATAEATNEPVCILSLDFKEAFDKMAHTYLYAVLEHYGLRPFMCGNIRKLYDGAESAAQINGFMTAD
jgi:hypothetical protein